LHFVKGYVCYVKERIYEIMTPRRLCEVVLFGFLRTRSTQLVNGWIVISF